MKAKNIIIIFIINYLLIVVVSAVVELWFLADKANHIQTLVRTAADLALEQSQVTDDFFVKGKAYFAEGANFKLKMPSEGGTGFKDVGMYEGIYGLSEKIGVNKEKIFMKLYDNVEFREFSKKLGNVTTPLRGYSSTNTDLIWYNAPKVAFVGLDILPSDNINVSGVKSATTGGYVDTSVANKLFSTYEMNTHVKRNGTESYYYTPLSLGITYINRELLSSLFINNMDLLMRSKYVKEDKNLNTSEGGSGILEGQTYKDLITGDLQEYNPINDGKFTLLRGRELSNGASGVKAYEGIRPTVEYKVIDMYDSRNDTILSMLFGANKGGKATKADYLKSLDTDVINPVTLRPYDTKPIVVAKVTFYVDIIVPYSTLALRDFRGNLDKEGNNYLDVVRKDTSGRKGVSGSDVLTYTRYFAVTP